MSGHKLVVRKMVSGYRGAERMLLIHPQSGTNGTIAIFYAHGFTLDLNGMYASYMDTTVGGDELREVAYAGYTVVVADYGGGSTWGNDDHWDAIDDAVTWCGAQIGTRTDKIGLAGDSMGFLGIANNAYRNPSRVAMMWARVPVVNLAEFKTRNSGTFGAAIEGAYGGLAGYNAALPTHDPSATALVNVLKTINKRMFLQYTASDELIPPSETNTFASTVGATVQGYPGTHATGFQLPNSDAASFVAQTLGRY